VREKRRKDQNRNLEGEDTKGEWERKKVTGLTNTTKNDLNWKRNDLSAWVNQPQRAKPRKQAENPQNQA